VFDLSLPKLLVLGVLALLIFGPEQLPKFAAQAGRALRELRRLAEGAQADLRENLGPEFSDFEIGDLHPKNFVRKHLLDDLDDSVNGDTATAASGSAYTPSPYEPSLPSLTPGERPPYDIDAT
jgi:sec-independent protein translocase protein TatB